MTARITRISRIRDYRSFRDFAWTSDLHEFARFNLVYGWNGSGKTALSDLFRHLETQEPVDPADGEVQFVIGGTDVSGSDIPSAALPQVRVFNRNSVDRTVFEVPSHQLPPVFYLGEDSVEKQKQVLAHRENLAKKREEATTWKKTKDKAQADLDKFCTDQARDIKDLLLTSGGGGPYRNYQAPQFRTAAEDLLQVPGAAPILADDRRRKYVAAKEAGNRGSLEPLTTRYPDVAALAHQVEAILKQTVVSSALPDLVADPVIAEWVGHGLTLHAGEHATDACRFCGQPLPAGRLERLEAHFNDRFREFVRHVDASTQTLKDAAATINSLVPEDARLLYPHLQDDYLMARQALAQVSRSDLDHMDALGRTLLAKRGDPFASIDIEDVLGRPGSSGQAGDAEGATTRPSGATIRPSTDSPHARSISGVESVAKLNEQIGAHNKYTDDIGREQLAALKGLEADRVAKGLPDFRSKRKAVEDAAAKASAAQEAADALQSSIDQLQLSIGQHWKPADELNREMAAYLGQDELRFEVHEAGYTITRNGEPAANLSEGERTAIAFMYFLKSLQDVGFRSEAGVVVIDDPVSSLDANSLYSAFGFMRDRASAVGQLFVMTHNFTFFRHAREWLTRDPTVKKDAQFYMLECEAKSGRRASIIRPLDPLLKDHESEYHYLFKRVHDEAHRSIDGGALAQFYEVPNIARRLLEAFLAFRAPDLSRHDALQKHLDRMTFKEPADRFRLERFLQLGSHFDRVGDPEHDLSTLSEARAVLLNILACMEATDSEHYQGMLSAIGACGN